jgi:hypothetical protein
MPDNLNKLKFGFGNSKISKSIATFSLPAGHTCPFAKECFSKANRLTGKLIDGKHCQFRCFAASQECTYPSVRKQRWYNFELLKEKKTVEGMGKLIQSSIPRNVNFIRIHVSGDYFSETYFLAWLNVALNNPEMTFYGYTKALPHFVKYRKDIPSNFRLTASKGGTHDHLIKQYKLKSAEVVFSLEEAKDKGLRIDHDDGLAMYSDKSFALLLHGPQPQKSKASAAWQKLIKAGIGGYNENRPRFEIAQLPFHLFIKGKPQVKPSVYFGTKQKVSK